MHKYFYSSTILLNLDSLRLFRIQPNRMFRDLVHGSSTNSLLANHLHRMTCNISLDCYRRTACKQIKPIDSDMHQHTLSYLVDKYQLIRQPIQICSPQRGFLVYLLPACRNCNAVHLFHIHPNVNQTYQHYLAKLFLL